MRFVLSTTLLVVALLLALGALAGCAPSLETTRLAAARTGAPTPPLGPGSLRGALPSAAGRFEAAAPEERSWGWTWASRREGASTSGTILVSRGSAGEVEPARPSRGLIAAELAEQFEGTAMRVIEDPLYNAYGPFGLAVGQSAAGTCGYAWQWIREEPRLGVAVGEAVSVRITLCQPGLAPAAIANLVKQLALTNGAGPKPGSTQGRVALSTATKPSVAAPSVAQPASGGRRYLAPVAGETAVAGPGRVLPSGAASPTATGTTLVPPPSAD